MKNNKRKMTFKTLAILFFVIAVAVMGTVVLGAENIHSDAPVSTRRNILQLNQEYVDNPYIIVGDRVFTYAELTASEEAVEDDSASAQMSAEDGYKILFDQSQQA